MHEVLFSRRAIVEILMRSFMVVEVEIGVRRRRCRGRGRGCPCAWRRASRQKRPSRMLESCCSHRRFLTIRRQAWACPASALKSQLPPFYPNNPLLPDRGLASWLVSRAVEGWDGLLTHPSRARPPGPAAQMIKCTYVHMVICALLSFHPPARPALPAGLPGAPAARRALSAAAAAALRRCTAIIRRMRLCGMGTGWCGV